MSDPPDVLYVPKAVDEPDVLFTRAMRDADWDDMRARRTASFGRSYDYSGKTYPERTMPSWLVDVVRVVQTHAGLVANNCLLNSYADGTSSMGFHSDAVAQLEPGTGVAIVSVGAERTLRFRRIDDRMRTWDFVLGSGSLLFMSDDVQRAYQHAVPVQRDAGARISLTFRALR